MKSTKKLRLFSGLLCAAGLFMLPMCTGCQVSIAGQTLPSGYYLTDDAQYFPKGAEFKLSREAAALREAQAAQSGGR